MIYQIFSSGVNLILKIKTIMELKINKEKVLSNLDEAIKKAKPNMDKIKDVDKYLENIRGYLL